MVLPDDELPDEELLEDELLPVVAVDVDPELSPALDFFEPPPQPLPASTTAATTAMSAGTRTIAPTLQHGADERG